MDVSRQEISFPSAEGSVQIYGEIFYPQGEIKGILQFAHGMSDYGGRYVPLFELLAKNGYVAAYNDHLGHGCTALTENDLGYFAHKDGYKKVIADFDAMYTLLDEKFPSVPHFVMGHSMGSFIVRCFLASGKSHGALIMGTASKNPLAGVGIALAGIVIKIKGERHRSKFLAKLAFGTNNKRITDSKHQWAWLSHDKRAQQNKLEDKKRNKSFTASAFRDLFYFVKYANADEIIEKTPRDLPIVFLSGAEDPLGPYEEGILKLKQVFDAKGFTNVSAKIFPNARHELCHGYNREKVFDFILQWLNSSLFQINMEKIKNDRK